MQDYDLLVDQAMSLEAAVKVVASGGPAPAGMNGWTVEQIRAELAHVKNTMREAKKRGGATHGKASR